MSSPKPITPNPPRWKPHPDPTNIVIPGLDTEASTIDQIEQIEQLITIKLQNIDENFAKIHNVLANKLLPAVKRYAVGTEPVREAAQFWTSFYEQAAQIRIPTYDDYSTVNEVPSESDEDVSSQEQTKEEHPGDRTERPREVLETTVNSETSFLPGHAAFSSTPATTARIASSQHSFMSHGSEDPSWTQSPIVRLSEDLKAFSSQPEGQLCTFTSAELDSINDQSLLDSTFQQNTIATIPSSAKGKGKDTAHPLLKDVLRHNLYSANDNSTFENNLKSTSPLKFKTKPKTPVVDKGLNPYLPPSGSSASWSGIIDLRNPSVVTPQKYRSGKVKSTRNLRTTEDEVEDDSFDGLPPGMSPPVLVSPVRPPRSSAELGLLKLTQTPTRQASERIQRDLVMSALKSVHKSGVKGYQLQKQQVVDSSMSTVPTPPSLSRYNRRDYNSTTSSSLTKDASLESMLRRIREDIRPTGSESKAVPVTGGHGSTPGLRLQRPQHQSKKNAVPSQPTTPMYAPDQLLDSDSDSIDSLDNTTQPSAAFLMASGGPQAFVEEDSFGSSNHSSDSLENEDVNGFGEGIVPVHPFATSAAVVDDGFDDDDDDSSDGFEVGHGGVGQVNDFEEETVFGVAPTQRQSTAYEKQNIRMLGEDLLQDTIGIGTQMAASGRVEESPTPANWGR